VARALRPCDHAAPLRAPHHRRPGAKAVAGLDEVTRAALEAAQAQCMEEKTRPNNVVELAGRRR